MEKTDMLKEIAAYYHIEKNADFARFFEISEQTAFQRRKQGILMYEDIYQRCPDISPDWLLSGGEGPMLRQERIENNTGNLNFGNYSRQVFRTHESESMKKALDILKTEQEAVVREQEAVVREQMTVQRAQEQITGLIQILQTK